MFAVFVEEVTQPVTVLVTATVYIPAAVNVALAWLLGVESPEPPVQVYVKLLLGLTVVEGVTVNEGFEQVMVALLIPVDNEITGGRLSNATFTETFVEHPLFAVTVALYVPDASKTGFAPPDKGVGLQL